MENSKELGRLRNILIRYVGSVDELKLLCGDAGIDDSKVALGSTLELALQSLLSLAEKGSQLKDFLNVIYDRYPQASNELIWTSKPHDAPEVDKLLQENQRLLQESNELRRKVSQLEERLRQKEESDSRLVVGEGQYLYGKVHQYLFEQVRSGRPVDEVVFIHFGAGAVDHILLTAMENAKRVRFFLHAHDSKLLYKGRGRVRELRLWKEELERKRLSAGRRTEGIDVQTYRIPPPFRGVRIDDEIVVLGLYRWEYTFVEALLTDEERALVHRYNWQAQGPGTSDFSYWGHNSPAILARKGHPAFEQLYSTFLRAEKNLTLGADFPVKTAQPRGK